MKGIVRPRGPGRWQVQCDAGYDPGTGKRRTRSLTVEGTKREADRRLRELIAEIEAGRDGPKPGGRLTVAQWCKEWLTTYAAIAVAPKTLEVYEDHVRIITAALGAVRLERLDGRTIQATYAKWLKDGGKGGTKGLTARTVHHLHVRLKAIMAEAIRQGLIPRNPVELATPPRVEDPEIKVLPPGGLSRLIGAADEAARKGAGRMQLPILVLAATGLRRGELLGLRWCDLDVDMATLRVEQTLESTKAQGLRFKRPKTKRSRRAIALPSFLADALRQYKAEQAKVRLAMGPDYRRDLDLIFPGDANGEPWVPDAFTKAFGHIAGRAGLEGVTPHSLRHTHATELMAAGTPLRIVSGRLGHSTVTVTADVYQKHVEAVERQAVESVDTAIRAAQEQAKNGVRNITSTQLGEKCWQNVGARVKKGRAC